MLLQQLFELSTKLNTVKTSKHAPSGLFSDGTVEEITKWLKKSHEDLKSAMSALNFYINRAGKSLSAEREAVLDKVKELLRKSYKD